jgi:hypothetical protein
MRDLTKLDQAIAEPKTEADLMVLFKKHVPVAAKSDFGITAYGCALSTEFVIRYLTEQKEAGDKISDINDMLGQGPAGIQSKVAGFRLSKDNSTVCLENILSLSGNYIGLLVAQNDLGHNCCFASYGLTPTRTWGFYQSNDGSPKFTISPTVNEARKFPNGNIRAMDRLGFRSFFPTLTSAPGVPVFGTTISKWSLLVMSFEGKVLLSA